MTYLLNRKKRIFEFKIIKNSYSFRLKEWEKEINEIDIDSTKLLVENEVDLEGPPRQMTYINAYKPSDGIVIPDDPPLGIKKYGLKKSDHSILNTGWF